MSSFPTRSWSVRGAGSPVELLIDRWGVPHIYAGSRQDAFFGQGFAVARDRLWQIDLWRKRGLGLLSADYGAEFLQADRAARLLLYRGDMAAEWAVYGAEAESLTSAFTAGINAYVDLVLNDPALLPVEFQRTGTRPAQWAAEDCVRIRGHGPMSSFAREVKRANTIARHGLGAELLRSRLEPAWTLVPPQGIAAGEVPPEVQRVFDLGTLHTVFAAPDPAVPPDGSNNWAIAGHLTATGRPILANDPHRLLLLPSLRYVSHLSAPGLDVIGAGEPAVPGISIGHNGTAAFGLTIHPADQSDLMVCQTRPGDPGQYLVEGAWRPLERRRELIPVRGGADEEVELVFTHHGTVLHLDADSGRAWALRSVWSDPGAAPYLASLRYLGATSWQEFEEARSHWVTPSVNHVYADTSGDIGWIVSGRIPHRPVRDGQVPLPGDGSHDWQGDMRDEDSPRLVNPARGWVATANEYNLPPGFDVARHKSNFDWADPSRYQAIADVLSRDAAERPGGHSLEDSCRLQTSFANPAALRLTALLGELSGQAPSPGGTGAAPSSRTGDGTGAAAARAIDMLIAWDGVLSADSGPGLLFELWLRRHLMPAVCQQVWPGAFPDFRAVELADVSTQSISDILVTADPRLGEEPQAVRRDLLRRTLAAAWEEALELAGPQPERWRWGDLHTAGLQHPLAARLGDPGLNTRRVPKGGSGLTPNAASYQAGSFAMTAGASFRMVLDVGNWDAGRFVNAPGQSGDPLSRSYDDHLEPWSREDYLPLLYSRAAVEAATVRRFLLLPAVAAESAADG